ncbi:signal transduction histidine kinase [Microbacterium sp. W4I4]|uniref:sensor histidine kinase n=1 Tax=Microbacterium sp. W4I4 TaxID=3042295 RepID=UPI002786D348|nr:histidine kinase [Microbacterium sp. W4I4]MDQ0615420.1 signal transduction histidine kinase [Microbacterium sp. W4I4]
MSFGLAAREDSGTLRLTRGEKLSSIERIALLVGIGIFIAIDVVGIFMVPSDNVASSILSISATAVFTLYLWSPVTATAVLGVVFALSFFAGTDTSVLLAGTVAAGMVMRLGSTALVLAYAGGFLVATAVVAYGDPAVPVNVGIYLLIAAIAGAVGFTLRLASDRGHSLEKRLAESAEQERQAVLAERRWIAGELHDSIAHHLTVVALHVQMLDDPVSLPGSQEAIRVAARKAMADLRFVIELADDGPRTRGMQAGDLTQAIDEARSEIASAGHVVRVDGDAGDERIPRVAEIAFARIVRESATNILKHAGPGEVDICLQVDDELVELTITSPLPDTPRRDLPSSGTGLNRMAERVLGASGEFSAGAGDGQWQVLARLPLS